MSGGEGHEYAVQPGQEPGEATHAAPVRRVVGDPLIRADDDQADRTGEDAPKKPVKKNKPVRRQEHDQQVGPDRP